ncbi:hypothetical protein RSSM_03318 [Rhodopirellula sallentina SM41]|uniref:Uncharacterized protein n=1 Tax=Rhodopirellula sallentina SM41 TaxID=1263870 RepID=M5U1Z4_9BACT|nr:hypothetical protein RSSM_03318 [Rhodopirellula sallentina SM41]
MRSGARSTQPPIRLAGSFRMRKHRFAKRQTGRAGVNVVTWIDPGNTRPGTLT